MGSLALPDSITVVLLDLYDTLARIDRAEVDAGRRRGAELAAVDPGCLLSEWTGSVDARSRGRMGTPLQEARQLVTACGAAATGDRVLRELVRLEGDSWRRGVHVYDDVRPALDRLQRRGRRLAIVSNCSWQTRGVLEATGLDREVEQVVLSFELGILKPDPAILRLALERLGGDARETLLVDDVTAHLDAARALGMATVLMDRPGSAVAAGHPVARDLAEMVTALGS